MTRRTLLISAVGASIFAAASGDSPTARGADLEISYGHSQSQSMEPIVSFSADREGIRIDRSGVVANCCLDFLPQVELTGGTLTITETDIGPPCLCPPIGWDLWIKILKVPSAVYDVFIYTRFIDGPSRLAATARLTVPETETGPFVRGEMNGDGSIDISDAIYAVFFLFKEGRAPRCLDAADANDDGMADLSDVVFLLDYLFLGGAEPKAPFPSAGEDPTPDSTVCSTVNSVIERDFIRNGDFNGDGQVGIDDLVAFLSYIHLGGPGTSCEDAFDGDDDGDMDLDDACIFCLLPSCCWWPFQVPPPDLSCGPDPTPDALGCERSDCRP